ncbi:MAG: hypothetical protein ABIH90_01845 [Candidatus Aenigmatarchaeota archaeon]
MADISSLLSPENILQFAGMNDAMGWLGVGVNFLINILVGGIILVAILEIFGHHWGEHINPVNAFFAVFIATLINMFGITGILSSLLPLGYYGAVVLSVVVWFVLIKAFFSDLEIKHAGIVSIVVVVANMLILPSIMGFVLGFLNL